MLVGIGVAETEAVCVGVGGGGVKTLEGSGVGETGA